MDYAILATLWSGPATLSELVGAVYDRTGRPVNPGLVASYLRMFERFGFVERADGAAPYILAERGSVYLAHVAA
jgi:hypothetical protein